MFTGIRPPWRTVQLHNFPSPFETDTNVIIDDAPFGAGEPYSLNELEMHAISYSIRCKTDWQSKRLNASIRSKWKREALEQSTALRRPKLTFAWEEEQERDREGDNDDQNKDEKQEGFEDETEYHVRSGPLTEQMIDWMLDSLEGNARFEQATGGKYQPSCFFKVYESDHLISSELLDKLKLQIAKLENVPESAKDWHPGSKEQVLDLVHPSLFPVVYGRTILRAIQPDGSFGEPTICEAPESLRENMHSASPDFQWLPTDFEIGQDGVKILSYINNLHPTKYAELYPIIADVFNQFVPMLDQTLWESLCPSPRANTAVPYSDVLPSHEAMRDLIANPRFTLRGQTVQVIVKLANIQLTPENSSYEGGVWHVEGMLNESIVATAIYYYEQDNITESSLAFRGTFETGEENYSDDDIPYLRASWGVESDDIALQSYGAALTRANRGLVFPNIYQHRVSPFELVDKTQPGHRKILCFFLVNPRQRIPSTTEVAPQQREWITDDILRGNTGFLSNLPVELWNHVLDNTQNSLMSLDEAKEIRERLMKERKYLVDSNTKTMYE